MTLIPSPVVLQDLADITSNINTYNNGIVVQGLSPRTASPQVIAVQVMDDPLAPTVTSGAADTNVLNKLVDTSENFVVDHNVSVGDAVINTTDDVAAVITAIETTTNPNDTLLFAVDAFPLGTEAYRIIKPTFWVQKLALGEWKRSNAKTGNNQRVAYSLPAPGTASSIIVHDIVYPVATPEDNGFYPPSTNA